MTNRMERKKVEKREAILDAAEAVMARKGLKDMTMDDVANTADVAKGTLYLYFKNKASLSAAIYARLNKEVNAEMKKSMDLYKTGSEKTRAAGTAVMQLAMKNPQKFKAGRELYQIKFEDTEDPNVQESLHQADIGIQMRADAYRQAIEEGDVRADVDPVSTAIFTKLALLLAFSPTSEQKMLLEHNNISIERYLAVVRDLIFRSTNKIQP